MFHKINKFQGVWQHETRATLGLLRSLTDASLSQAVTPGRRDIGRLAWHIVLSIPEMMNRTGLHVAGPAEEAPVPPSAAQIAAGYEQAAASLAAEISANWDDATLQVEDAMYGEQWKRGETLLALVLHQAHHRGQLTVLMRQAGLPVTGVYGPAEEEWGALGAPAPPV